MGVDARACIGDGDHGNLECLTGRAILKSRLILRLYGAMAPVQDLI
jgi:hypothetical protein